MPNIRASLHIKALNVQYCNLTICDCCLYFLNFFDISLVCYQEKYTSFLCNRSFACSYGTGHRECGSSVVLAVFS